MILPWWWFPMGMLLGALCSQAGFWVASRAFSKAMDRIIASLPSR